MKYVLNYMHHGDIKQGGHAVYSTDTGKEVAIQAATDEEAVEKAKKEWASITGRKEKNAAVVFVSLVKVLSWKPRKNKVPLDEEVSFEKN